MGHCFSLHLSAADESRSVGSPTTKVIKINGDLREYGLPISAAQVLDSETSSSSSSDSSACFLCHSDRLCYDEFIPVLSPSDCLSAGQIYFVLPRSKLHHRLAASDMAALAVKASLALRDSVDGGSSRRRGRRRSNKRQISPVLFVNNNSGSYNYQGSPDEDGDLGYDPSKTVKSFNSKAPVAVSVSRSGSVRKMQRLSSRRMKLAVRSFRMRLSTIYEGSVL